jgi:uncharacterized 2Fe-2S/4Fe-4S cluster protein (DUF4445 family)
MLEAAGRAGLTIETPCGGSGTCGKCRLQITEGASEASGVETQQLAADELTDGWRLACQTKIAAATVATIPESSLLTSGQKIITETQQGETEILPAVRKVYLELDPPSLSDSASDLMRLQERIGTTEADLEVLQDLGRLLREAEFKGTAVLTDHRLIDFERGDTTGECYGVAIDIGTTTLVGVLMDLCTGRELAISSRMNPQVSFGDDVLSRIKHASEGREALTELRDSITSALAEMIAELSDNSGAGGERIYELACAGNTTMQHLLCGIDVSPLGRIPFAPAHTGALMLRAREIDAPIHPRGTAYVFPVIGGFVGGDLVAGILATRLGETDGPSLMIDVGTNGEIILAAGGKLWAASTAAGPAFEGARISCGMRAAGGAIEKVVFDDDIELSVIGDVEPTGICGSGLVDLAAGLLDTGIVSPQGRLLTGDDLPRDLPAPLRKRLLGGADGQGEFVLAAERNPALTVTQRDVRELQLATGAIRAGVNILLRAGDVAVGDLKRILIAGGFGSFIRRNHAQRIGLLPGEIDHRLIRYVGNTSLAGAKWALLSTNARQQGERLASHAQHVQLSEDPDFQNEFAEAMIFPGSQP